MDGNKKEQMTTQATSTKKTPKEIALFAFEELKEKTWKTDKNSHRLQLQIYTSDDDKIYVAICPIVHEHVVVHEEHDGSSKLDYTILE